MFIHVGVGWWRICILQGALEWHFICFCSTCKGTPLPKTALSVTPRSPNIKVAEQFCFHSSMIPMTIILFFPYVCKF